MELLAKLSLVAPTVFLSGLYLQEALQAPAGAYPCAAAQFSRDFTHFQALAILLPVVFLVFQSDRSASRATAVATMLLSIWQAANIIQNSKILYADLISLNYARFPLELNLHVLLFVGALLLLASSALERRAANASFAHAFLMVVPVAVLTVDAVLCMSKAKAIALHAFPAESETCISGVRGEVSDAASFAIANAVFFAVSAGSGSRFARFYSGLRLLVLGGVHSVAVYVLANKAGVWASMDASFARNYVIAGGVLGLMGFVGILSALGKSKTATSQRKAKSE